MDIDVSEPAATFKTPLAETYNNHADERDPRGESVWHNPSRNAFLERMRSEGKIRLLEIGAGTGHTARWFADRGIEVVATDLSADQVAAWRRKRLESYTLDFYAPVFRQPASTQRGRPQEYFDAIFTIEQFAILHPDEAGDERLHVQLMVLRKR